MVHGKSLMGIEALSAKDFQNISNGLWQGTPGRGIASLLFRQDSMPCHLTGELLPIQKSFQKIPAACHTLYPVYLFISRLKKAALDRALFCHGLGDEGFPTLRQGKLIVQRAASLVLDAVLKAG